MRENNDEADRETTDGVRNILRDVTAPLALEDKVVKRLKEARLIDTSLFFVSRRWVGLAASVSLALLSLTAGYYLGQYRIAGKGVASDDKAYLLLLYQPPQFSEGEHVAEYGNWMGSLRKTNPATMGEALTPQGWTIRQTGNEIAIEERPVQGSPGTLAGFFLIRAPSNEQAVAIATSCPHLKYNGIVELHPVLETSK